MTAREYCMKAMFARGPRIPSCFAISRRRRLEGYNLYKIIYNMPTLRILAISAIVMTVVARAAVEPTQPPLLPCSAGPASEKIDTAPYAKVLHVDQRTGDDFAGDGSAEKPYATLAHAFGQAGRPPAAPTRIAILVSAGRYRQPTLLLKSRIDLYGGFPGFGKSGAIMRDVFAHPTVLETDAGQRIALGADDTRLDGFHLVNARVRGKGAALLCDGASPTIANCIFRDNRTLIPRPWNPPQLHETANDGGAIMCLNAAAPRIENCLFIDNATECGRGGAIASDLRAAPVITRCVFAHNRAGIDDPLRSSDGGAVAWFDWSAGEFTGNIVVANAALASNDAGGIWIALWSAPLVRANVIVANYGDDDAGGLFVGGQEHRYGAPLDPYPPAARFNVVIDRNLVVGNANKSKNSGAMRITMESRATLTGNTVAANTGGVYFQRSEINARGNIIWQDWQFLENKPTLGPSHFADNIFIARPAALDAEVRATFENNRTADSADDAGTLFAADGAKGRITAIAAYVAETFTTRLTLAEPLPTAPGDYAGRVIRTGNNPGGGAWRVIKTASAREIIIWGRLEPATKPAQHFEILRTFTPKKQ